MRDNNLARYKRERTSVRRPMIRLSVFGLCEKEERCSVVMMKVGCRKSWVARSLGAKTSPTNLEKSEPSIQASTLQRHSIRHNGSQGRYQGRKRYEIKLLIFILQSAFEENTLLIFHRQCWQETVRQSRRSSKSDPPRRKPPLPLTLRRVRATHHSDGLSFS